MQKKTDKEESLVSLRMLVEQAIGRSVSDKEFDAIKKKFGGIDPIEASQKFIKNSYHYVRPDYSAYTGEVTGVLERILPNYEPEEDGSFSYLKYRAEVKKMPYEEQEKGVTNVIYQQLLSYQKDGGDNIFGLQCALALVEGCGLHGCLPAVLEVLRQDFDFMDIYFISGSLDGMPIGVINHIIKRDDLPMLLDFMKEDGLLLNNKLMVALAVSNLPVRDMGALPLVQQWLYDVLNFYYSIGECSSMFDESMIDAIAYCCIHTRAVQCKKLLISCYGKFDIPRMLVGGGADEVRRTIKNAELGTLDEDWDSGEEEFTNACFDDDKLEDDDDEWDDDDVDDEDFNPEDYDIQEYQPYAQCSRAEYMPSTSLKKYTLRVTLNRIDPEIWRELEVPSNIKLPSLAGLIITAMGWDEDHLHQFVTKSRDYYATSSYEMGKLSEDQQDGGRLCIGDLLKRKGSSVIFEYDFGDSWEHTVKLVSQEKYADDEKKIVKLLDGKRSCPPEDCGGVYGYEELCEAMTHPKSSRSMELMDWLGSKFDPEYFPLDEAKAAVRAFNK